MDGGIIVRYPDAFEERRLAAEVVADVHNVLTQVVERAPELLPGEAVEDVRRAWSDYSQSFVRLADALIPANEARYSQLLAAYEKRDRGGAAGTAFKEYIDLSKAQLTGSAGKAKRSALERLRDRFNRFFHSAPFTRLKQLNAGAALSDYLELAGTVLGSIPILAEVKETVLECIDLFRMLAAQRTKRRD